MGIRPCIYVVDDDKAALLSVQAVLLELDHEIRCFSSAEQFLAEVSVDRPGCLVTDLQMPGITGIELQQALVQANSPLSVVVVTGVADLPTTLVLKKFGAVALLEKPYEPGELLRVVQEAVERSGERWAKPPAGGEIERRPEASRR